MRVSFVTGGGRGVGHAIAHATAGLDTWVAVAGCPRPMGAAGSGFVVWAGVVSARCCSLRGVPTSQICPEK